MCIRDRIDGYSTGWLIDGDAHQAVAEFGPQRAVQASFVVSAAAVVGVAGLALAPLGDVRRHRRPRGPLGAGPHEEES